MKVKSTIDEDIMEVIDQSAGVFSENYLVYPFTIMNYINGEKEEIHYIGFSCYNENFNNLETTGIDLKKIKPVVNKSYGEHAQQKLATLFQPDH